MYTFGDFAQLNMTTTTFFNHHLVFRLAEYLSFIKKHEPAMNEKNCRTQLYRYVKKGKLSHVRKGLYVVNSDLTFVETGINPFMIAAKSAEDSVLAYHTALEFHGAAYTDFNIHTFISCHRIINFSYNAQDYRPLHRRQFKRDKFITSRTMLGIEVFATSLERTIVDVLDKPELSGGWEEIHRSLERIVVFDVSKSIDYALSLNKASIVAKLGYFLESRPDYTEIDPKFIDRLLPHIPKNHYYIDRNNTLGKGTLIKKWNIIVPNYLHEKQWEEPGYDIDY